MATTVDDRSQNSIAYFEEPEPGVPDGCTGWYHSRGQYPLSSPQQVFEFNCEHRRSPVQPEIAGPFASMEEALDDLEQSLETLAKQI
jgi:hypothetical protein